MPEVERGGVQPPNERFRTAGNRGHSSDPVRPMPGDRVEPSNETFRGAGANVGRASEHYPQAAIKPGRGAVPVNPWDATGQPNKAAPLPDDATLRPPKP